MTAVAAGFDRLTVKVMVPAPSLTLKSLIENCGAPSLSTMVDTAVAGAGVVPLTGVAVRLKVSLLSEMASSVVAMRSCTEVAPAAMVTVPITGTQAAPLKNSSVLAALVSAPSVAVPLARLGVKTAAVALAFDRLTVKTACPPSTTGAALTDRLGVSSFAVPPPGKLRPSSTIWLPTEAVPMVAPTGADKLTLKVSLPSNSASLVMPTVIV